MKPAEQITKYSNRNDRRQAKRAAAKYMRRAGRQLLDDAPIKARFNGYAD